MDFEGDLSVYQVLNINICNVPYSVLVQFLLKDRPYCHPRKVQCYIIHIAWVGNNIIVTNTTIMFCFPGPFLIYDLSPGL